MSEPLTEKSGRIAAARKLTRRAGRDAAGAFLAEGRQAVSEALAMTPDDVREVFATESAAAARAQGMTYNRFIQGLNLAGVEVDRKILADLAVNDAPAFAALVETAKANLPEDVNAPASA